eukprot:66654-Chlamydomonas_euryale.AAC.2
MLARVNARVEMGVVRTDIACVQAGSFVRETYHLHEHADLLRLYWLACKQQPQEFQELNFKFQFKRLPQEAAAVFAMAAADAPPCRWERSCCRWRTLPCTRIGCRPPQPPKFTARPFSSAPTIPAAASRQSPSRREEERSASPEDVERSMQRTPPRLARPRINRSCRHIQQPHRLGDVLLAPAAAAAAASAAPRLPALHFRTAHKGGYGEAVPHCATPDSARHAVDGSMLPNPSHARRCTPTAGKASLSPTYPLDVDHFGGVRCRSVAILSESRLRCNRRVDSRCTPRTVTLTRTRCSRGTGNPYLRARQ